MNHWKSFKSGEQPATGSIRPLKGHIDARGVFYEYGPAVGRTDFQSQVLTDQYPPVTSKKNLLVWSFLLCLLLVAGVFVHGYIRDLSRRPFGPLSGSSKVWARLEKSSVWHLAREMFVFPSFSGRAVDFSLVQKLAGSAFLSSHPDSVPINGRAPSSSHVALYFLMEGGVYRFNPESGGFLRVARLDIRRIMGQYFPKGQAPIGILYVADKDLLPASVPDSDSFFYSNMQAQLLRQNVDLFCASEFLTSGTKNLIDRAELARLAGLSATQSILFAQFVGFSQ